MTITVSDDKDSDTITVTINVTDVVENNAPVFTEGTSTSRSIAENTPAGQNIGTPVAATDADTSNTLTYRLGGTDASVFAIVNSTGQLQTNLALNYERKPTYTVIVTVSDGKGGSDSINVTINVTNVVDEGTQQQTREETVTNTAPVFTDGDSTTRSIAENTVAGTNIGSAIGATDADVLDTLNYSLGGTDANSFAIVSATGQLQTKDALDYETKTSYSVTITVSDQNGGTDTITVTINVTNVAEIVANNVPVFTEGDSTTRSIAENTVAGTNIGSAIGATDADAVDTLAYSLGGTDANSFAIVSTTGQIQTKASLDYETKSTYEVTVTVSDSRGGTDSISVTINISDVHENVAPVFADGATVTRSIPENTVAGTNIGQPLSVTDANVGDTLTYTLSGTDANSFAIASATGQLQTKDALDYETKTSYSVTITVSDQNGGTDTITVTINVTDVVEGVANNAPVFTEGDSTTRSIAENRASGINIGSVIAATDADTDDTLTYTLSGTDASAFTIVGTSGQLQTSDSLNYEVKSSYSVTVAVSDNRSGTDSIDVTININDVNDPPRFVDGTSTTITISEDIVISDEAIGTFNVIDEDGDQLYYHGTPAFRDTFIIGFGDGGDRTSPPITWSGIGYVNIYLKSTANLNYDSRSSYTLELVMGDGQISGTIDVTINITDVDNYPPPPPPPPPPPLNNAPFFYNDINSAEISENIGANRNVSYIPHRDIDNDRLTFTLSGADANLFVMQGAFIKTKSALDFVPFDYETRTAYSVTVTVSDGRGGTDSTPVTINITNSNEAPVFDEGTTTTRNIAENSTAGINIGSAVSATDQDADDTITYTLGGTDTASFSIDGATGQLKTKAALDYETKSSYTVTITATDEGSLTDTITVTISVRDLNETPSNNAPVFTDGETATRSVAENTAKNTNIETAVAATDADTDSTLSYQLSGIDTISFSIDDQTGQLKTNAALDYETKNTYTVTVTVTDGSSTDTITVTINVTDANDAPVFSDGNSTIRNVNEGVSVGTDIGATVIATDADKNTLNYTLGGTDAASFSINANNGQLRTNTALRFETKSSYTVTVTVSDGTLTDTIAVTINVINVNSGGPAFVEGTYTSRTVEERTAAGTNIGPPLTAVDIDDDALVYRLGVTQDGRFFDIEPTTGQLKTKAALNYDTKDTYYMTAYVQDKKWWGTYIDVTVYVIRWNNSPTFTDGTSATRSVAENTAADQNIGAPVSATDSDSDRLTYTLGGTNAASFSIDSATGQIKTKAELDYETKNTYTVTLTVSDDKARGTVSIPVTINVTDITDENNSAPIFTDGNSTTRSVAENTAAGENIGTAVSATDANNDTLAYTIGGTDAGSFSIVSTTGQLQTNADLDYEIKRSYTVTIAVSDGKSNGTDSISVTINVMDVNELNNVPEFTDGATTTRSIAENTAAGTNIGSPVDATDADVHNSLTYSLGGTDAASFAIVSTTGQLQTNAALDYETNTSYTVTVSVSDNEGGSDTITVTINVNDVIDTNQVPVFSDGATTTRSVIENTAAGEDIGSPVTATDPDDDTVTYSLGGTDAASFTINSTTGHLQTSAALDYETKSSYTVTITATDSKGGENTITVTINVTDSTNENSPPVFSEGSSTTRSLDEYMLENYSVWYRGTREQNKQNVGSPITATDADGDTLTYKTLNDLNNFEIDSSGQLSTIRWIDYEYISSYSFTVSVSDGKGGSDSINVRVNVTDVNESPYFGSFYDEIYSGSTTTLYANDGTEANTNIGDPLTALDEDANTTLAYSLSGTDASSFTISSTTGQITNNIELNADTKASYSVVVAATDGSIPVTINVIIKVVIPPDPLVSDRSPVIRQALVDAVSGVNSAADLNAAHLATITRLNLSNKSISSLSAGDFNDLINLTDLDLDNNAIISIPNGLFDDLTQLRNFGIRNNRLSSIDGNLFQNNSNLASIDLRENRVNSLPDGIFEGLTNLSALTLQQRDGVEPAITLTVRVVEDDDNDDQTAKYEVYIPTGAPETLRVEVWAVRRALDRSDPNNFVFHRYIVKHADFTISAGSTTSNTVTITREDKYEDSDLAGDDPAIYLATRSVSVVHYEYWIQGFDYTHSLDRILVIPADTSGGAPSFDGQVSVPETTALLPNYPNPFNPETWIPYQLAKPSDVSITIYDIRGSVVRQLNLGQQKAGYYIDRPRSVHWDGRNATGERVANGVYFYQLKAGDYSYLRKMLILK